MTLRDRYDRLERSDLAQWAAEAEQEDLHLDFKTLPRAPSLTRDDRKNFATAVSGFANSDGGLIVWGIEARKDPDSGIDAAQSLAPVADVKSVLSQLQSLTGQATSPIVDGVEHKVIKDNGASGYLVTFVPRSESGPHMALQGVQRYYKRSGDSFYQMEHFDLADMFARRPQPRIELSLSCERGGLTGGPSGRTVDLHVLVGLANRGRGMAKYPLLEFKPNHPFRVSPFELDGNGNSGLPPRAPTPAHPGWSRYAGGADHAIHPDEVLHVTLIKVTVSETSESISDLELEYRIACEGIPLTSGSARISGDALLARGQKELDQAS